MDLDVLKFQRWRTLDGTIVPADLYRRNGRLAASFHPSRIESPSDSDPYERHRHILAANLTPTEERTWLRLLSGASIAAIADEDGRSRTAIYERIRGKKGSGGMVAKNRWVQTWWRRRQSAHTP